MEIKNCPKCNKARSRKQSTGELANYCGFCGHEYKAFKEKKRCKTDQ